MMRQEESGPGHDAAHEIGSTGGNRQCKRRSLAVADENRVRTAGSFGRPRCLDMLDDDVDGGIDSLRRGKLELCPDLTWQPPPKAGLNRKRCSRYNRADCFRQRKQSLKLELVTSVTMEPDDEAAATGP